MIDNKIKIITRELCSGCKDIKEILEAYDIKYEEIYAKSDEGMVHLVMSCSGPDTLLPAVICTSYGQMEMLSDLLNQLGIVATLGVKKT